MSIKCHSLFSESSTLHSSFSASFSFNSFLRELFTFWRRSFCNCHRNKLSRTAYDSLNREHATLMHTVAWQFSNLYLGLPKWSPVASDFVKALTNTFVNFSFAYVNIQYPTFALATNNSIWVNYDFMQIWGALSFSILDKNFILSIYISKRYQFCIFVWADCGSDVIVIYEVIEH